MGIPTLPQDVISRAINSFRKHVFMVITKNGGHIEKYIYMDM